MRVARRGSSPIYTCLTGEIPYDLSIFGYLRSLSREREFYRPGSFALMEFFLPRVDDFGSIQRNCAAFPIHSGFDVHPSSNADPQRSAADKSQKFHRGDVVAN
jgi:hypothetical protein